MCTDEKKKEKKKDDTFSLERKPHKKRETVATYCKVKGVTSRIVSIFDSQLLAY